MLTKEANKTPVFEWLNREDFSIKTGELSKIEIQTLLPKYVLGYSSGENELLSLPFFKTRFLSYDEYADKLAYDEPYGYPPQPESRLIFLDTQYSQAILLCNLLMQDEQILAPLCEEVGIEDIDRFRLIICQDKLIEFHEDILIDKKLTLEQVEKEKLHLVELTSNLKRSIEALKKCATCYEYRYTEQENEEEGREYLVLDYKVTEATKKAFCFHFSDKPLELFQLFQILISLNAYVVSEEDKKKVYQSQDIFINQDIYPIPLEEDRILRFKDIWIKKKGIDRPIFTKELSDGEHQFLHSLGALPAFQERKLSFLIG